MAPLLCATYARWPRARAFALTRGRERADMRTTSRDAGDASRSRRPPPHCRSTLRPSPRCRSPRALSSPYPLPSPCVAAGREGALRRRRELELVVVQIEAVFDVDRVEPGGVPTHPSRAAAAAPRARPQEGVGRTRAVLDVRICSRGGQRCVVTATGMRHDHRIPGILT